MPRTQPELRSQATRNRILDAARSLFSEKGFDQCTVRAVASAAAIHPSLVMRYFGSKEGLFMAAMKFDLHLPDLSLTSPIDRGETLARHFLERWEGADAGDELPALLRVAVTHPDGREQLLRVFQEQLGPAMMKVVSPKHAAVSVPLIATQAIGLAFSRYVLRIPAVVAVPREQIISFVGRVFQQYLDLIE